MLRKRRGRRLKASARFHGDLAVLSAGFEPVASANARVLVLGSLPGRVSLEKHQYYAQPRNAFWPIMGRLLGFEPQIQYARRIAALKKGRIALWDVCASADRTGSLDSAIVGATVRPNDLAGFLVKYRRITTVHFNGVKAAALYTNLVMPSLPRKLRRLEYAVLPSTSPAHAAMTFADKLRRWSRLRHAIDT
jgi:TDG/mug DNA glycosylase family protein